MRPRGNECRHAVEPGRVGVGVAGKNNWGRMPDVIAKINQASRPGADISANTYAYTAWFNSMSAFIPRGRMTAAISTDRAPERSRHPRAYSQRHYDAVERLGQRMGRDFRTPRHNDRKLCKTQS